MNNAAIAAYRAARQQIPFTKLHWGVANVIGIQLALLIEIIQDWCDNNMIHQRKQYFHDDHWWTKGTYQEWETKYPSMGSARTLQRFLLKLESDGYVLSEQFHKGKDNTKFYRVNEEKIGELYLQAIDKFRKSNVPIWHDEPEVLKATCQVSTTNVPIWHGHDAKLAHSSIYKQISTTDQKTYPPTPQGGGESERTFGFEIPQEPIPDTQALLTSETKAISQAESTLMMSNVPPSSNALQKIKYDPALGVRPPRQRAKFKYPDGPWLNENGQMRSEFIRDRANLWRTGDSPNSKSFGAMAIEDVEGCVCAHYMKAENHAKLESDWNAFVTKNQRYVGNVHQRLAAGINIPESEQLRILAIAPSLTTEPVEPAYSNSEQQSVSLPPSKPVLRLEATSSVSDDIWNAVAADMEELEVREIIPEGAESVQAYKVFKREDEARHWENFYASRQQPTKPTPASAQAPADIKRQIEELRLKKSMPSCTPPSARKQQTKLEHWNNLMQTGIPSVIAEVERQARAQGYVVIDGQVSEVDF